MAALAPGDNVLISKMKKRTDLNGKVGEVLGVDSSGRLVVEVGGEQLKIKHENMEKVEEEEEEEEGEEEEEEESCDENATLEIPRTSVDERLGLNFASPDNLTLEGVSPGTVADTQGAEELIGWRMTEINGTAVATLSEAGPIVKTNTILEIQFVREATVWVPLPQVHEAVEAVAFRIPPTAPLNPHAKIEILKKNDALIYKVNGKPRSPFTSVAFSLLGDHYTRELCFPSLGTCMWLPREDFFNIFARLKALVESVSSVKAKGFANRFKESALRQVTEIEEAKTEEELQKNEKKKLKNINAKKRKVLRKRKAPSEPVEQPAEVEPLKINQEKKATPLKKKGKRK